MRIVKRLVELWCFYLVGAVVIKPKWNFLLAQVQAFLPLKPALRKVSKVVTLRRHSKNDQPHHQVIVETLFRFVSSVLVSEEGELSYGVFIL